MGLKTIPERNICDPAAERVLQPLPPAIAPGGLVDVRGARWEVGAAIPRHDCHELRLSAARDGRRCILLWPFDRPIAIDTDATRRIAVVRLRQWRRVVTNLTASEVDPCTPRARASADVLDYQLAPAVAAASGEPRLLLADEVGLGKTIQAGWIVADWLGRHESARILIAVPAGLRRQWDSELRRFFGLEPAIADAAWLRGRTRSLPPDMNPWTPPGVYIASIDFLKRADLLSSLEPLVWDVVVVDEAHMAMAPTDRHAAIQRVASRSRLVVAISATPYSGDAGGFASMAALGGEGLPVMFRRSREETGDHRRRRHRFTFVALTPSERQLQQTLERYSRDVWTGQASDLHGARLAVTILRKRALSSPAAALRSLAKRLELLQDDDTAPRQLSLLDDDDAVGAEDDLPVTTLGVPGLADADRERRILQALVAAANRALGTDSKQRHLVRLLRRIGHEPAIVFTEYRDTLLHLAGTFPHALLLHGGLSTPERATVQERFNECGGLLIATDAASCGLNLQARCRIVVNYELPWNPARLEQRIGRVDRIGQRRCVHAITLVARHTAEDLVIAPLTRRLQRVASTLGERDRLASFLTDARTAGIVMGGGTETASDAPAAPLAVRAPGDSALTTSAGNRLRVACTGRPSRRAHDHAIVVASMRASRSLPEGLVVLFACAAASADGFVAARRVLALHLPSVQPRPCGASDARGRTETIAAFLAGGFKRVAANAIAAWFADACRLHESAVDRWMARERALLLRRTPVDPAQPGLFDKRAMRRLERLVASQNEIDSEHRERLASLARGRTLRLECLPAAVLIAWR